MGVIAPKDAVLAKFTDAGSKVTHIALGYDTNGDDDFSTADDLLILVTGTDLAAGLHYVGNPLDVGVFDKTEFRYSLKTYYGSKNWSHKFINYYGYYALINSQLDILFV